MLDAYNILHRFQEKRFKATVKALLPHTDFYSKLFKKQCIDFNNIKKVQDWQNYALPLVKKSFYVRNWKNFIVRPDAPVKAYKSFLWNVSWFSYVSFLLKSVRGLAGDEVARFFSLQMPLFSSGTESGIPTPVMLTVEQKKRLHNVLEKIIQLFDEMLEEKRVGMNLFPYAPHLAWHSVHEALDKAGFNLSTAAGGAMPTEHLVKLAKSFKPNIIVGMGSYLRHRFLPEAIKQKVRLPKKVIFVNGASKLYEGEIADIKKLARKLGVRNASVMDFYGASELKEALMPQCREKGSFHHMSPLSTIVRTVNVLNSNKDFITDWHFTHDEGYSCLWNIDGAGTLLEGYLLGDIYKDITLKPCLNCHLPYERIKSVDRIRNVETQLKIAGFVEEKIKGARINVSEVRDVLLKMKEVKEAQVIVTKGKDLMINVVPERKKAITEKIKRKLAFLELKPKIKITSLEKMYIKEEKFEGIVIKQ